MTHFGIICPALTGHLNPMTTLGHELQRRGHRVTLFGILDASNGVPMVAIPIANDQPGVAARIAWTGTGEVITLGKLTSSRLQAAVKRVLTEDSYKQNALRLQAAIRRAGGVSRAADLVERVAQTDQPVLAQKSP